MEGHSSKGQSPQWAVVPMEEEEEEEEGGEEEEEEEEEEEDLSQCKILYFYIQRFTTDNYKNTSRSFTKPCMYIHVNRNNHFPCSNCSFLIEVIE